MYIVKQDAEHILLETISQHWEKGTSGRCVYLRFSTLEKDKKHYFPLLLKEVEAFLDEKDSRLFICDDDDVFVLSFSATHKKLADLLDHIAEQCAPAFLSESFLQERMASLFEISVDQAKLKALCTKKIERLAQTKKALEQKQKQLEEALHREKVLNLKIDEALVASLDDRRRQRESIEVLIVEDEAFSLKLVENLIKDSYSVVGVKNGLEALHGYAKAAPDILFLDIGLPDITGHDVLKKVLEIDPQAYVVMLSGHGDRDNVMKALQNGAKDFVVKPFNKNKLLQSITKCPFVQAKQK